MCEHKLYLWIVDMIPTALISLHKLAIYEEQRQTFLNLYIRIQPFDSGVLRAVSQ